MLGIRKHRGAQIDLHLGDPGRFACDLVAHLGDVGVATALQEAEKQGARHLVLAPAAAAGQAQAKETFATLREFLDARTTTVIRRVTVALASHAQYDAYGEAMVQTFPEAESAHTLGARPRPAGGL
jgi:hypothetical protein